MSEVCKTELSTGRCVSELCKSCQSTGRRVSVVCKKMAEDREVYE